MSEKNLTELEWKKFSKGKGYKDAAFAKALVALDKARSDTALQLDALKDIEKEADSLRKANKADKDLGSYLDGLDKALDKQRKQSELDARKQAKDGGDEEEESPAQLTTKLLPLIRMVRKGDEMQVLLASVGSEVAVLMSRRAISPSSRRLMTEYLDSGTPRFFPGTAIYEENALTFVMKTQAAGLAKKIKAALLKQVELRLKVRVRGEDPDDIDDDGDPAEPGDIPDDDAPAQAASATPAAAPSPQADPQKEQFDKRMADAEPKVLAALAAQGADGAKIRAVADFVRGKGDAGQYKAALAGMDSLDKLLAAVPAVPPAPPLAQPAAKTAAAPAPDDQSAAFTARLGAMLPAIKALTGDAALGVKLKVSEAGNLARKKEFGPANQLLDVVEATLAGGAGAAPAQTATGKSALETRLAEVEERYLALLARKPADATRLRAVFGFASEQAEAGEHAKAAAGLDQLERLMAAAEAALATPAAGTTGEGANANANAEAGYEGLVAYRKTLLDFRAAAAKVDAQIAALKSAIPSQLPDQADMADDLADSLNEYNEDLLDIIDDAMNAAENRDSAATRAVASQIDQYIGTLASDPLVGHADANPFGVAVNIRELLGKALADIRKAMPAFG